MYRTTFYRWLCVGFLLSACGDDDGSATDAETSSDTSVDTRDFDVPQDGPADTQVDAPIVDNGQPPLLRDFQVSADDPSRITFESDKPIQGSDHAGFFVAGREVVEVSVSAGLSGHYLRLNEPLDFWDNTTVRYEGGGDLRDQSDRALRAFTLTYVENLIPEPDAPAERFVSPEATGGGDGLSEATAWTISEAFESAEAGMNVWLKAGDYGDQTFVISLSGTADEPIKFVGYVNTPGDITENYWTGENEFSAAEMPTLTGTYRSGGSGNWGRGIYWENSHYVIVRNFQMTNYRQGMNAAPDGPNTYLIFDRVNGYEFIPPDTNNHTVGFSFESRGEAGNTGFRFLNSVISKYRMVALSIRGDGFALIDNVRVIHTDGETHPDYQISVAGHHNIVRNCHIEIQGSYRTVSTHGIGVRGGSRLSNTYNLIERSTAININEGFYIRNEGSDYNVIRDVYSGNNGATTGFRGGVYIWGGADHNVVERLVADDVIAGVVFKDNHEEDSLPEDPLEIGRHNVIRNSTFRNARYGIGIEEQTETGDGKLYDNLIVGCTFDNVEYLFNLDTNIDVQNLELVGNSLSGVANLSYQDRPLEGTTFTHCNFWEHWMSETPEGEGNISVEPGFVDREGGDFRLRAESLLIDQGQTREQCTYDMEQVARPQGAGSDIGAYEFSE